MKYCFLIFWTALGFSCRKSMEAEMMQPKPIVVQKDSIGISWLALGDSYTIGQGVNQSDRFPYQALEFLKMKFIQPKRLTYVAKTGWTSADLLKSMGEQNLDGHNFVSLLVGVNDQYQGIDTNTYRKNFTIIYLTSLFL